MSATTGAPVLAAALLLDVVLREPPVRVHPVVWMGRLLDVLEARLPDPTRATPSTQRVAGGVALGVAAAVVTAVAGAATRLPWPARAVLLWGLLPGRLLLDEVAAVEQALADDGLAAGRRRVARLVSRPTEGLDAAEVRASAVSTLAENVADGVVGTLWWAAVGGLPAAALHRLLDTADSRWGYRTPPWRHRGWAAARADDVAAWVPSRLTAVAWYGLPDDRLRREAARTPSPNGGWPMAAAALALDVRLDKPGVYTLHAGGRPPGPGDVATALRTARRVLVTTSVLALAAAIVRDPHARRGGGT